MGMAVKGHTAAALLTLKKPLYQLYRRLGWHPDQVRTNAENLPPSPGFDSQSFQHVASRYTDFPLPSHIPVMVPRLINITFNL